MAVAIRSRSCGSDSEDWSLSNLNSSARMRESLCAEKASSCGVGCACGCAGGAMARRAAWSALDRAAAARAESEVKGIPTGTGMSRCYSLSLRLSSRNGVFLAYETDLWRLAGPW